MIRAPASSPSRYDLPAVLRSLIPQKKPSGSDKVNDVLGRQRASFVAQQLRDQGLKTDAMSIESLGKKSLEVPTPDNTKEQRNRRVEVILR